MIKDLRALLNPGGRGQLVFGFLGLRFSSVERVWFGYRFTDTAAWYAAIPHVVLYAAGAYGLISRRRWGWALVLVYLLYIPLSEFLVVVFYGFGYLTGQPAIPAEMLWAHIPYYVVNTMLVIFSVWMLARYRDIFVR